MTNQRDNSLDTSRQCKAYVGRSIVLCAALFAAGLMLQRPIGTDLLLPLVVATVFSLVADVAEALAWKRVAPKPADTHITFFMAVSGFRFLLALAVMVAYYLAMGRAAMLPFIIVFLIFYAVMLAHHVAFFTPRKSAPENSPQACQDKDM